MLLIGAFFYGCGVKGPPVPARLPSVPAVLDLACRVEGSSGTLTWRLAESLPAGRTRRTTFGLYRSRSQIGQPDCDDCPVVFEKVSTLPYVAPDNGWFSTEVPLNAGVRYLFKVRLETDGAAGPDSLPVACEWQPVGPIED